MRWLVRGIQVLYTAPLVVGLAYWWYVWRMHSGMPPQDEALGRWASSHRWAFHHALDPVVAQLTYPVFWFLTRRLEWTGVWSILRKSHLWLVLLVVVMFLLLLLATPDVSGFRS